MLILATQIANLFDNFSLTRLAPFVLSFGMCPLKTSGWNSKLSNHEEKQMGKTQQQTIPNITMNDW